MKNNWKQAVKRMETLLPHLNEKQKRLAVATEAIQLGKGCISYLSVHLSIAPSAINRGIKEVSGLVPVEEDIDRVRRKGGGRKSVIEKQPGLKEALLKIIDPVTRGDPESPLRWTSKSCAKIAKELQDQGFKISADTVENLLKSEGYSLQANSKTKSGKEDHPDRDEQFKKISKDTSEAIDNGIPVISVDTKKKELVGEYKNNGQEWTPSKEPIEVLSHDFPDPKFPKAVPYGIYDVKNNQGFVNVGTDHDTGMFAVQSIRSWWHTMGEVRYPNTKKLLVIADSGGSNGSRNRLWKKELQSFATETGLSITVSHLPPGTSKWNKIEHRLFSEISKNWRGRPLVNYETVVQLIASTKTKTGLTVEAKLDNKKYEKGIKISQKEFEKINLNKDTFHGEWNYRIDPLKKV